MSKATVYPIVPEVCGFCADGLAWMTCYDDLFRCRVCVHAHAKEMGWDEVPDRYKKVEKKSILPVLPPEEPEVKSNPHFQAKMF